MKDMLRSIYSRFQLSTSEKAKGVKGEAKALCSDNDKLRNDNCESGGQLEASGGDRDSEQ